MAGTKRTYWMVIKGSAGGKIDCLGNNQLAEEKDRSAEKIRPTEEKDRRMEEED
jgi:hypothetical protein